MKLAFYFILLCVYYLIHHKHLSMPVHLAITMNPLGHSVWDRLGTQQISL